MLHIKLDRDEVFTLCCEFMVILMQHGVGGALCIPSLLGMLPGWASSLACHGALGEVGYEVQDTVERLYDRLFGGPAGKARQQTVILILLGVHHAMGMLLVVPMNLYFGDNVYYHELVFLLQFAAFTACALQQFGYTLDVNTTRGLITMKII